MTPNFLLILINICFLVGSADLGNLITLIINFSNSLSLLEPFLDLLFAFVGQNSLANYMRSLSIGLVTLTVAVAISLAENDAEFTFDRMVILENIIKPKSFLASFLFLFLPLFIWGNAGSYTKIILFSVYSIGVFGFLGLLYRSYRWIQEYDFIETPSGYRHEKRYAYLEEMEKSKQKLRIWERVWELDRIPLSQEIGYLEKFIDKVNSLIENKEIEHLEEHLRSLVDSLDEMSLKNLTLFKKLWRSSLDWHKSIFEINRKDGREYFGVKNISTKLVSKLTEKGIAFENTYVIFDVLEDVVENCSDTEDDIDYLGSLIRDIAPAIFSKASAGNLPIWSSYFPDEWKVTLDHFKDGNNYMANIWLTNFLNWAEPRIRGQTSKEENDKALDASMRGLFPEIDPRTFSIILSFVYMGGWPKDKRMKTFVESQRAFGLGSRAYSWMGEPDESIEEGLDEMIEQQREKAIELASKLFESYFTQDNLEGWIEELDHLELDEEYLENYRDNIKEIFKDIEDRIDKEDAE